MTNEPSRQPSHTLVTPSTCLVCGSALTPTQQRYCTRACQQQAYRLRHQRTARRDLTQLRTDLQHRRQLRTYTIYECPTCETRSVGDQRCADCNTFTRAVGLGGNCPECDAVVLLSDLIGEEARGLH